MLILVLLLSVVGRGSLGASPTSYNYNEKEYVSTYIAEQLETGEQVSFRSVLLETATNFAVDVNNDVLEWVDKSGQQRKASKLMTEQILHALADIRYNNIKFDCDFIKHHETWALVLEWYALDTLDKYTDPEHVTDNNRASRDYVFETALEQCGNKWTEQLKGALKSAPEFVVENLDRVLKHIKLDPKGFDTLTFVMKFARVEKVATGSKEFWELFETQIMDSCRMFEFSIMRPFRSKPVTREMFLYHKVGQEVEDHVLRQYLKLRLPEDLKKWVNMFEICQDLMTDTWKERTFTDS